MVKELKNVAVGDIIEIYYKDEDKKNKLTRFSGYVYKKGLVLRLSKCHPKHLKGSCVIDCSPFIDTYDMEKIKSYRVKR